MRPSLLDRADLRRLRPLAGGGGLAAIAACLVDGGVVQLDAQEPTWSDRDRIVAGGPEAAAAVSARLVAGSLPDSVVAAATAGEALGVAVGTAIVSARQGAAWRVWCVLDRSAVDDGAVWETARAAALAWPLPLTVLAEGEPSVWAAAGWRVEAAAGGDPAHILAALDHTAEVAERPIAVAVTR